MCDPATITAISSGLTAASGVAALAAKPKPPDPTQASKTPDAALTEDDKRKKLLAQLAAGNSKTQASGLGGVSNVQTGAVKLGG